MCGYLIERLFPTGWQRDGEIFWRASDAIAESERAIREREVRGVRVLPCTNRRRRNLRAIGCPEG
jgi:hypothetical protein